MDVVNITHGQPVSAASEAAIVECCAFAEGLIDRFGADATLSGLMSAFVTHGVRQFGFGCTESALRLVLRSLPRAEVMLDAEGEA